MSRKGFAVAVAMLSVTSAAYSLVLSLVNPALDTLWQALHADQFGISWVLTSCLLSSAVLTPGSVVAALPRGLPVLAVGRVRFETLNQAVNGDLVIAGQAHGLALPGKPLALVRNLAVYEIREGKIAAWRDYTNPQKPASFWACSRRTTGRKHP